MKRCFVFAAGTFYGLRQTVDPSDVVIAADAGYRACLQAGTAPTLVLGDFDSMEEPTGVADVVRVPVEKDDTDTMLAVKEGLRLGCGEFFLYGATGGTRLDHTLANLQTLLFLRRQGARGWLYDADFVYTAIENETLSVPRTVEWQLLSAFAVDGAARGVCESGVQYPLRDAVLFPDFPLGVSNHITAAEAVISVSSGTLLLGWQLPPL